MEQGDLGKKQERLMNGGKIRELLQKKSILRRHMKWVVKKHWEGRKVICGGYRLI